LGKFLFRAGNYHNLWQFPEGCQNLPQLVDDLTVYQIFPQLGEDFAGYQIFHSLWKNLCARIFAFGDKSRKVFPDMRTTGLKLAVLHVPGCYD
jgi:hypothetical protein